MLEWSIKGARTHIKSKVSAPLTDMTIKVPVKGGKGKYTVLLFLLVLKIKCMLSPVVSMSDTTEALNNVLNVMYRGYMVAKACFLLNNDGPEAGIDQINVCEGIMPRVMPVICLSQTNEPNEEMGKGKSVSKRKDKTCNTVRTFFQFRIHLFSQFFLVLF